MQTYNLHHVGIIMPDEKMADAFAKLFGLEEDYRGYVPEYHSLCIFTKRNGGSAVEFVIPDGGNLTDYNKGKGGIHHIALLVKDVKAAKEELNQKGLQLLEEVPVKGAGEFVVNFVRPRSAYGILVEFIEETK
ncbi:MAG TPA: 4-hydroxyphenylpyruvate dioxygenase [Firmicutes bacterium]|jgi:methylmalonyl-CoA/ethylmalonyl-CoA epimerase|nr:4-hydroxyphenylpyruvate dioxygenase [Bacillota bacterium]